MSNADILCNALVAATTGCPDIIGELHLAYYGHMDGAGQRHSLNTARDRAIKLLAAIEVACAAEATSVPLDKHAQAIMDAA